MNFPFLSGGDEDDEPHEHEWLSLGVYKRDLSITPTVVVVCQCGAWTTKDLKNELRVGPEGVQTWRFSPPEKLPERFA